MELIFHHPEFEYCVREALKEPLRPLTEEDALHVTELDLSNFDFPNEDWPTLTQFRNLQRLYICSRMTYPGYWNCFSRMEDLWLETWGERVDFSIFEDMKKLAALTVSGGDLSNVDFLNLDALASLPELRYLELHEFGSVNLQPLTAMGQLRTFALRYAKRVENIDVIGAMTQLEALQLDGLRLKDLDFLDRLPSSMSLEMCGIEVQKDVDIQKWKRFAARDICEISVGEPFWDYIDVSELND